MISLFQFLTLIALVSIFVQGYETHYYELNITRESLNADCSNYAGEKLLVNGQLPGPAIAVTSGDHVKMLVRNLLPTYNNTAFPSDSSSGGRSNDITIHAHGIRQYGTPEADGVPFLTQDPIKPGESFLYEFKVVHQSGTYFYHAHVSSHDESVFGPFIVYESDRANPEKKQNSTQSLSAGPYTYDDERTIVLSEWWHETAEELTSYLLAPGFHGLPDAESILINGRTVNDPTYPQGSRDCRGYSVISVDPEKTYRIRVIGATTFRTLGFAIAQHDLTVIEADGTMLQPYDVPFLELSAGQRFSVLLKPKFRNHRKRQKDYSITTIRRYAEGVDPFSNGMAILRYTSSQQQLENQDYYISSEHKEVDQGVTVYQTPRDKFKFPQQSPHWFWPDLKPMHDVDAVARHEPDRTLVFHTNNIKIEGQAERWEVNNVSFEDPKETILTTILSGERQEPQFHTLTADGYDPFLNTYPLRYMETVDIVIQTTHAKNDVCRSHPWHTHGHSFWEIAYGPGKYDPERDADLRNVPHPFLRDVTLVYPIDDPKLEQEAKDGDYVPCGWTKIRLLADNPGVWAIHCHNTLHMIMGMMTALEIAPERLVLNQHHSS
ncbi:Cupredoxin [Phascolomyces articulosus]|uniref:Cupredoxin n=1 Tax=Phascolomyces articulosus TaxID=60185 RepID=A0AAD5KA35_9FUNG|nr:Cupredoxin [Phascolomyces articulosus]